MRPDYVTCSPCGKRAYHSRKHAKQAARETPNRSRAVNTAMAEYRCPVNEDMWHVGHKPYLVMRGVQSRSEAFQYRRTG